MIFRALLKIAVNAGAIYVAHMLVEGVNIYIDKSSQWQFVAILVLIGAVIWVGNTIIKPLVKVLTFPLILVTFGLFNVVINMVILWGADMLLPQLEISGFLPLLFTTIIISVINGLLFFI